jgi:hypothetical protein
MSVTQLRFEEAHCNCPHGIRAKKVTLQSTCQLWDEWLAGLNGGDLQVTFAPLRTECGEDDGVDVR